MNKPQLQALLSANDVPFAQTDTVPTLKQLLVDNDIPVIQETPDAPDVLVDRRPAPSPAIAHNVDFPVVGAEMSNIRMKYAGRSYTTASAQEKRPLGFNAYLYKKGDIERPFIADCNDEAKFITDFVNEDIHSFVLTSSVTGNTLPATQYDEARPEVFYELNTIITKKARAYHRKDKFEDFVFNPDTFVSNPELLSKSGLLDKILEESVG